MSYIDCMIKEIIKFSKLENLEKVGVYSIHHDQKPDRLYVGSTTMMNKGRRSHRGFYKRFYDHIRELKLNKHHSKYLQNTVNKYGIEGITFTILESCNACSVKDIRKLEQKYIDMLKPVYNHHSTVYPKGRKWTEKEREKQSIKMLGVSLPDTVYEKLKKQVTQYTMDDVFVKQFNSIRDASKELKIDPASISKCIAGKRISAGGYIWK